MGRDHDGHAGAVLMAFVLGAVSGAAVALLWAPTAGEDTRRLLNEKAREGRERAGDAAREGREFVSRQRDTISTALDRGREAYDRRTAETPVATDKDVSEAPA
jgi:gas vesicle protein